MAKKLTYEQIVSSLPDLSDDELEDLINDIETEQQVRDDYYDEDEDDDDED